MCPVGASRNLLCRVAQIACSMAEPRFGLGVDQDALLPRLAEKIELEHAADMARQVS